MRRDRIEFLDTYGPRNEKSSYQVSGLGTET